MADISRLEAKLEKLTKAQQSLPFLGLVVGVSTALQYAGVFAVGALPPWLGLVVLGLLPIQWILFSRQTDRLMRQIAEARPTRMRQCPTFGLSASTSTCPKCGLNFEEAFWDINNS